MIELQDVLKVTRLGYPNSIKEELEQEFSKKEEEKIKYRVEQCIEVDDPRNHFYSFFDHRTPPLVRIVRVVKRIPEKVIDTYNLTYTYLLDVIKEYPYDEWDEGRENGWYNQLKVIDPRKTFRGIPSGYEGRVVVVRELYAPLSPPNEHYSRWLEKSEVIQMYSLEEWDDGLKLYKETTK